MNLAFDFLFNLIKKKEVKKTKVNDLLVSESGEVISKYVITESIWGNWNYHISHGDNIKMSLCGKDVMPTNMRMSDWNNWTPDHIPTSYCSYCDRLMKEDK